MAIFRTRILHQGAMLGAMLWGAIFVLLLETAAPASALEDNKQIDFLNTRWEALDEFQRLRGEHREEDGHEETPVFDEASPKQPCASEGEQARRGLQSICVDGDAFRVTSTSFPFLEGCFTLSDDGESLYEYNSSYLVGAVPVLNTTFNNETLGSFWYVVDAANSTSVEIFCVSEEDSTDLDHPADATWICDEDGDGVFYFTNASDFSTTCGCFSGAHGGSLWSPLSAFTTFGVGLTAAAFLFVGM